MTRIKELPHSTNTTQTNSIARINRTKNQLFWEPIQNELEVQNFQISWSEISQLFKMKKFKSQSPNSYIKLTLRVMNPKT